MKNYIVLIPRYLKKQTKRSILNILGITLSIALITSVGIIAESINRNMVEKDKLRYGDYHSLYLKLNSKQLECVKNNIKIEKAGVECFLGEGRVLDKNIVIDLKSLDSNSLQMFNREVYCGRLPIKPNEIVLEDWILEKLELKKQLGQKINITYARNYTGGYDKEKYFCGENKFVLVGILKDKIEDDERTTALGLVTEETVKRLVPTEAFGYNVYVKIKEGIPILEAIDDIKSSLKIKKELVCNNDPILDNLRLDSNGGEKNGKIPIIFLGAVIVVASMMGIYNSFNISVVERIQQFGILRSLGASPSQIRKIVLGEAVILSAISIPFGIVIGIILSKLVSGGLAHFNGVISRIFISSRVIIASSIIGMVSVILSALNPSIQAAKVSPMQAIKTENNTENKRIFKEKKWHLLLKKIFGISGKMAYQNLWRNKKRFLVTVSSMSMGIILFIVFSFWAASSDISKYPREEVYCDYVMEIKSGHSFIGYTEKDIKKVKSLKGIDEVYKSGKCYGKFVIPKNKVTQEYKNYYERIRKKEFNKDFHSYEAEIPMFLYGYSDKMLNELKKYAVKSGINKKEITSSKEVLVIKDFRTTNIPSINICELKIGDEIVIKTPYEEYGQTKYKENKCKIGNIIEGINSDIPDNIKPQNYGGIAVIGNLDLFEKLTNSKVYNKLDIKLKENADTEYVDKSLKEITKNIQYSDFTSFKKELEKLLKEFKVMSTMSYSIIVLISIICILNILNTLSSNIILRKKEFGTLRSIGMTVEQLKRSIRMEGFFYGIISAFWGSVLGSILAYVFYNLMKNDMTYLEWNYPYKDVLLACIVSIVIGILSTLSPAKRIGDSNIIDAIKNVEL